MSLELGWMPPGQAGRYVAACREAGLLVADGEVLRLSFDAKAVEVPRGFRPDPGALPAVRDGRRTQPAGPASAAAQLPVRPGQSATPPPHQADKPRPAQSAPPRPDPAGSTPPSSDPSADDAAPSSPPARGAEDIFATWLPKVAAARGEDISATLAAVEAQQEASGGFLHAEPALLRLGAEAGLDVREAAQQALKRLQA